MRIPAKVASVAVVAVLGLSGCGVPLMNTTSAEPSPMAAPPSDLSTPPPAPDTPTPVPTPTATPGSELSATPDATPTARSTATPSRTATAKPAGAPVIKPGTNSARVSELQARLAQVGWFSGNVTEYYGDSTAAAVRGFQAKRGLTANGTVDQATWDALVSMTRKPTADELTNKPKPSASSSGKKAEGVDPRCMTGRVLCISKRTDTLRWMNDGKVLTTLDVRFGTKELPTREGTFSVNSKSRNHVSTLYHTPMPYALFFSGGQAVHYSPDFAARGYRGGSHGCVNVRNKSAMASLFDQVRTGDKVVVYR